MSHFIARLSFWVDLPQATDKEEAERYLNELIDKLAVVETAPTHWDEAEWDIHEIQTDTEEETNE
jgi:hypothetical protein